MLSLLRSVGQYSVSNPTGFDRASFWLQEYMMTAGLLNIFFKPVRGIQLPLGK